MNSIRFSSSFSEWSQSLESQSTHFRRLSSSHDLRGRFVVRGHGVGMTSNSFAAPAFGVSTFGFPTNVTTFSTPMLITSSSDASAQGFDPTALINLISQLNNARALFGGSGGLELKARFHLLN